MEFNADINELMPFAAKWIQLDAIVSLKVSKAQTYITYHLSNVDSRFYRDTKSHV